MSSAAESVIVDASLVVPLFVADQAQSAADALFDAHLDLHAPEILPIEVMAALTKRVRRRILAREQVLPALAALASLPISLSPNRALLADATDISLDHRHPLSDCLYVALARARGMALATADVTLAATARRLGVALWTPR